MGTICWPRRRYNREAQLMADAYMREDRANPGIEVQHHTEALGLGSPCRTQDEALGCASRDPEWIAPLEHHCNGRRWLLEPRALDHHRAN
jgi:hypothetical protein